MDEKKPVDNPKYFLHYKTSIDKVIREIALLCEYSIIDIRTFGIIHELVSTDKSMYVHFSLLYLTITKYYRKPINLKTDNIYDKIGKFLAKRCVDEFNQEGDVEKLRKHRPFMLLEILLKRWGEETEYSINQEDLSGIRMLFTYTAEFLYDKKVIDYNNLEGMLELIKSSDDANLVIVESILNHYSEYFTFTHMKIS